MTRLRYTALAMACGLAGVFAPTASLSQEQQQQANGGVTLREVDIRVFIEDVSRTTGRTFIIDPRVQGRVTILAQQSLSEQELFDVFMATLRVNGFIAVPTSQGAYRIIPDSVAAREPSPSGGADLENAYVTQVFTLRFADADSVVQAIRPMLSERGQVSASRRGNSVVVVDYGSTIARLRQVVARLDQDNSTFRSLRLRNTSAQEMARVAQSLATAVGEDAGARALVQAVPVVSSNTLILRGDERMLNQLGPLIESLDAEADFRAGVQVIALRYAVAEDLVPVLQQISTSLNSVADENGQSANRRANIASHRATNALIISADPETQEALANVVRSLDVPRQQVLVEAIIVEVSDNIAQELGLQFVAADRNGDNAVPFLSTNYGGASAPNLLAITGALLVNEDSDGDNDALRELRRAAVSSLIGSRGALLGIGGERDDGAIFGLILNALGEDTESNVLSTPSVMTLDNETASILVGQQIPITTGEALGDNFENQFRTVRREDVGVQLEVRPQIGEGGSIRLQIRQEVSDIFGPVSADSADLITNRREIETVVQVDAGEIIVLGGLIQENVQRQESGIPGLRRLPIAGRLFRSESESRRRTNLMVFLRPTIVNSAAQVRGVTQRQYDALRGYQGLDPGLAERLQEQMRRPAPAPEGAQAQGAPPPN